jgi:hypothetical protein
VTRWPGALALLILTALLRAPSFARVYLSDDEAIYAVIGRALASSARLYVDVVDHKPPAIYWLYGAVQSMVGDAAFSPRRWLASTAWPRTANSG